MWYVNASRLLALPFESVFEYLHLLRAAAKAPVLDISTQLGACPPLGFWDPLGLSKYPDPAVASSQFRRRRIIEIQHGRVSMFACIGYIVPEYFRWPGMISSTGIWNVFSRRASKVNTNACDLFSGIW